MQLTTVTLNQSAQSVTPSSRCCCGCSYKWGVYIISVFYVIQSLGAIGTFGLFSAFSFVFLLPLIIYILTLILSIGFVYGVLKGIAWPLLCFVAWIFVEVIVHIDLVFMFGYLFGPFGAIFPMPFFIIFALLKIYFIFFLLRYYQQFLQEKATNLPASGYYSVTSPWSVEMGTLCQTV